jgi:rubrerythrin
LLLRTFTGRLIEMKKGARMANDLSDVLRQAMLSERDGYQFYSIASEHATDSGAAEMFQHLAHEEMGHFNALQKKYRTLLERGTWDAEMAWDLPWEPDDAGGIFSPDFVRRIQGHHFEMAALSIGILLEKQAYEFYTHQADAADDQSLRLFFGELARWEEGHYRMLLREDEAMKAEYWAANRFEPLD